MEFTPPVPHFLDGDEKQEFVDSKQSFMITGVETAPSNINGKPAHTYTLRRTDKDTGEVVDVYITFTSNTRRALEAKFVIDALSEDASGVGPVRLIRIAATRAGNNDAWGLEAVKKSGKDS